MVRAVAAHLLAPVPAGTGNVAKGCSMEREDNRNSERRHAHP
jgi:hypothetical protein